MENFKDLTPNTKTLLLKSYRERFKKAKVEILIPGNSRIKRLLLANEIKCCKVFINHFGL